MITALFDAEQRSKRRLVKYNDIPKMLVDGCWRSKTGASSSMVGEFHSLGEAAWVDVTRQKHEQRWFDHHYATFARVFLTPEKTYKRKIVEMLIAMELEQKFSKQQIFEFYANRVDLGQRGSFTISGFRGFAGVL